MQRQLTFLINPCLDFVSLSQELSVSCQKLSSMHSYDCKLECLASKYLEISIQKEPTVKNYVCKMFIRLATYSGLDAIRQIFSINLLDTSFKAF